MNEDEAYEELIEQIESTNLPKYKSEFPHGIRFPFPLSDNQYFPSDYDLTHRKENSKASDVVRVASR